MTALLFDLDDTIICLESVAMQAWDQTYETFAHKIPDQSKEKVIETMLESSVQYWSDPERHLLGRLKQSQSRHTIVENAFTKLKIINNDLTHDFAELFTDLRDKLIKPFPDAIETLQTLQNRNIQMALITNGPVEIQYSKIDRFNLRPFFKTIVVEGEFGIGKPDPAGFLHALKELNTEPKNSWMIGDSLQYDIAGAKPLGIKTAWNNWSKKPLPSSTPFHPDLEINSIKELLQLEL